MTRFNRSGRVCLTIALAATWCGPAAAWDEHGHVIITELAHEKLPPTMPAWLRTSDVRARLAYLSAEPDRWRGQHNLHLDHINKPDHYLDIEMLEPYGMTLDKLPPLRRQYTDLLATARAEHPDRFPRPEKDIDYTKGIPGFLPYSIAELQWKVAASWTTLKTYEKHAEFVRDDEMRFARDNVVFHMGILSHFVGDAAQPLHLSDHHNGWVGPNPKGYTTRKNFHQFIDGGVIDLHQITPQSLMPRAAAPRKVSTTDYWSDIAVYLAEGHALVEPLYMLDKSGELKQEKGRRFIEDRLVAGGAMLAGVWVAGYEGAVIDDFRVRQLLKRKPASHVNGSAGSGAPADAPADAP
jgi:hypothetical protein